MKTNQINLNYIIPFINAATSKLSSFEGKIFTLLALSGISFYAAKRMYSHSICNPFLSIFSNFRPTLLNTAQVIQKASDEIILNSSGPDFFRDTKGHFFYQEYTQHFAGATQVIGKYFDKIIKYPINKEWEWVYVSQKEDILAASSLKTYEGTCRGNCCALAKVIIKAGRILSADELKKSEDGEKFPKRAIGFQLFEEMQSEICSRVDEAYGTLNNARPLILTSDETQILDKRVKYVAYVRVSECLQTYGLSFKDVAEFSNAEFSILYRLVIQQNIPFEWARERIFKQLNVKNGKEMIQKGAISGLPDSYVIPQCKRKYPSNAISYSDLLYPKKYSPIINKPDFTLDKAIFEGSDLIKECPEMSQQNFSGFIIIVGKKQVEFLSSRGHALLFEIDHRSKTYVIYNNNEGFFTLRSMEECFDLLRLHCEAYKYEKWTFSPFVFQKNE